MFLKFTSQPPQTIRAQNRVLATICKKTVIASLSHGLNRCLQCQLWNGLPFLGQNVKEFFHIVWGWLMVSNSAPKSIPQVFNGTKVR